MTISLTYRLVAPDTPPAARPTLPDSRHRRRKARLVMPAIGASTTGDSMTCRPMCNGGRTAVVADMVIPV
ncbi:hypothetical protein GCM10023153_26630 [Ornithinibacter aureus]|uniref:Uncharacterized protein n=1 Tax=Ornithinibacter aureus TaxID=622664 RepID=A0ABP8K3N9_9MICO